MTKHLANIVLSTGTQVFSTEAEYTSFITALSTTGSPMEQIEQYNNGLVLNGTIISQKHHRIESDEFLVSKIFNSEESALSYKDWLVTGLGKSLTSQWMEPIGWSFQMITIRPLTEDEFNAMELAAS